MSLKDKIFSASDLEQKTVFIEEWDVTVTIKELNAKQRMSYFKQVKEIEPDHAAALLICMSVYENGQQVFSEEDAENLRLKNFDTLNYLASECLKLNGIDVDSAADAEKN